MAEIKKNKRSVLRRVRLKTDCGSLGLRWRLRGGKIRRAQQKILLFFDCFAFLSAVDTQRIGKQRIID